VLATSFTRVASGALEGEWSFATGECGIIPISGDLPGSDASTQTYALFNTGTDVLSSAIYRIAVSATVSPLTGATPSP
jgi:hypothetical protein